MHAVLFCQAPVLGGEISPPHPTLLSIHSTIHHLYNLYTVAGPRSFSSLHLQSTQPMQTGVLVHQLADCTSDDQPYPMTVLLHERLKGWASRGWAQHSLHTAWDVVISITEGLVEFGNLSESGCQSRWALPPCEASWCFAPDGVLQWTQRGNISFLYCRQKATARQNAWCIATVIYQSICS